ncbi:MAG: alpha-L-fucosidase [Clostridia bacterium]|nr:alpha-L-fucosidase [Clostridia bacterium]
MSNPTIKKRKDCFFGLHCDIHADPERVSIFAENVKESEIREICEKLKPDFVQVDSKGHPGWASFYTSMNNAMPKYAVDHLAIWRKVTKEYGIALYCHHSGVYDIKYCAEHPEDAVINANGEYEPSVLPMCKYYDELFIPQISELVEKYDIDGIWVDGDCWSVKPDYRPETLARFEEETGIALGGKAPKTSEDPYFKEYLEFTREGYRKTLCYYVDVLHEKYPNLQICSNWAFSDYMPEKVFANVDFLSGDVMPVDGIYNCVHSSRYAGRMLVQQNMPWDLMSWNTKLGVYGLNILVNKKPIQIMQEVSTVIALGGAYQDSVTLFLDGSPDYKAIMDYVSVGEFARERQPYCFRGKMIHQAVMLVSTYDRYSELKVPFERDGVKRFMGHVGALCDAGQSLELASEHALTGNYDKYPLVIVPEIYNTLKDDVIDELKEYVLNGGSLMLVGTKTSELFAEKGFGFKTEVYSEQPEYPTFRKIDPDPRVPAYFSLCGDEYGITYSARKIIADDKNAKVQGLLHTSPRHDGVPFAVSFGFGKGKISVIGIDMGTQYYDGAQCLHRQLIRNIADDMYTPLAKIESVCGLLEIVCLEKDGHLMLQLVNANGEHANARCVTEETIPPVLDIKLSIKVDCPPEKLLLQPGNKPIDYEYRDGRIYFDVDRVNLHSIVEVI